jgi:hypothetical protein
MNNATHGVAEAASPIIATRVPADQRLEFLPRHFDRFVLQVEHCIYQQMRDLAAAYTGGLWEYWDLDNGGCYLVPPGEQYRIEQPSNYFQGTVSAEAAGIIVTLYVMSTLSFKHTEEVRFADHFHQLRAFAAAHAEAALIFSAID